MQTPTTYVPCPNCGSTNIKKVGYTWWGGALGPSMLTHVKCQDCKTQYNGKTGQSNQRSIIIYMVVTFALAFVACGAFAVFAALMNN